MKISLVPAVAISLLVSTFVPLSAHHSWPVSMDKLVTVKGTVLQFEWANPHPMITLEVKTDDGKVDLTAVRTFVRTGDRIDGRAVITTGLKAGDRVVAVGQLKLQSGAAVAISTDPPLTIPDKAPRN